MTRIEIFIIPISIFVGVVICLLSILMYYWISQKWSLLREINSQGQQQDIFTTDADYIPSELSLPPTYSSLSLRLPPSYSQACRMIGYRMSQEQINNNRSSVSIENQSSTSLENQSEESVTETSLGSMNNYINLDVTR